MEPEVVVVGGGAIGVSAAYELARRGARVTLLERDGLGGACSSGNAGLLCPSHSAPLATPAALAEGIAGIRRRDAPLRLVPRPATAGWLAHFVRACRNGNTEHGTDAIRRLSSASLELHAELAPLGTGFERRGILSVYETEARLELGRREAARSGLDSRVLSAAAARALEPALHGSLAGAIFTPAEAHVDPRRYVAALATAAARAGADVQTGVEVQDLRDGAVVTSAGILRPRTTVLAAGAWSGRLARSLGLRLPLTGGKGYHVDFAPAEGDPRMPMLLQEARVAVTPLGDRLRVAGLLELARLDLRLDARRAGLLRCAAGRVVGIDGRAEIDVWCGLRPCTPDGLPVIGQPARLPGVVVATGHAMKGISLAPVTGRLVAEVVTGESPSHDLAPFSPDRFC